MTDTNLCAPQKMKLSGKGKVAKQPWRNHCELINPISEWRKKIQE